MEKAKYIIFEGGLFEKVIDEFFVEGPLPFTRYFTERGTVVNEYSHLVGADGHLISSNSFQVESADQPNVINIIHVKEN